MAIQGPMTGIRVLEMGNQVAPATCTRMMADLGAEVIKVENTHGGDTFRAWPRMLGAPIKDDCNPIFDNLNANKKSISIDTKTEEGLAVMEELLKTADIFITNVRTKGLKKMGLDYDSIRTRFPKLVMGQVGAYGSQGPESWKPGYDSTAFWARSGFMSNLTVDRPGESQAYPIALPMGVGDIACAMALMAGCNAALLKARETGVGDYIEIPLYGTAVYMCNLLICGTQFKYQYPRTRYGSTPFGSPFLCKDGRWFLPQIVNLLKDGKAYWEVLGCTDYLEDPAYMERVNFNDLEFNTPVMHRLEQIYATKTTDEWVELFMARDLSCEKIANFNEVLNDEQAIANEFVHTMEYADLTCKTIRPPIRSANTGITEINRGPMLGENTEELLREIGLDDAKIADFKARGIVNQHA